MYFYQSFTGICIYIINHLLVLVSKVTDNRETVKYNGSREAAVIGIEEGLVP